MKRVLLLLLVAYAFSAQTQTSFEYKELALLPPQTEDSSKMIYFKVSPNPIKDEATVKYKLPKGIESGEITISNILGNPVAGHKHKIDSNQGELKFSVSDLLRGLYFFQIKAGIYGKTDKIIVR